ncbi:MAG: hypothetical protein SGPRY_006036 [Prymnesium sp.]
MFSPGTHNVVRCEQDPSCHQPHHPAINEAIATIERELAEFGMLSAYDEDRGQGTLRYLQLSVERSSRTVQITLVVNAASLYSDSALLQFTDRLWTIYKSKPQKSSQHNEREGLQIHSIWINLNPSRRNNIVSYDKDAWNFVSGHGEDVIRGGSLIEAFPSGASFVLPPFVFRQANLDDFDRIVAQVCDAVPSGSRVCEWYAGVGVLGLSLVPAAEWVRCSDINPPFEAFEASRALLAESQRSRITYAVGAAGDRISDAIGANVAVVDPPRKGLDHELLNALCDRRIQSPCSGLEKLVYISCGFQALMRDADALLTAGWGVQELFHLTTIAKERKTESHLEKDDSLQSIGDPEGI